MPESRRGGNAKGTCQRDRHIKNASRPMKQCIDGSATRCVRFNDCGFARLIPTQNNSRATSFDGSCGIAMHHGPSHGFS